MMMRAGISDHSIPARKKIMEQKTKSIARVEAGYRNKINGRAVEILVEEACIIYEKQKLAMIEKNPESMRVLKAVGNQGGLYIARFDKKSKPDFEGVLNNGQAIIFDVKSTEQDKIKASALSEGQAAYLKRYHSMGAVSFILVCLQFKDFYMVPWETWKDMKVLYGHLHMTRNELEPYCVSTANGYIHFLEHIAEEG